MQITAKLTPLIPTKTLNPKTLNPKTATRPRTSVIISGVGGGPTARTPQQRNHSEAKQIYPPYFECSLRSGPTDHITLRNLGPGPDFF